MGGFHTVADVDHRDILYASSANTPARLGIGANTYVLTSNGTTPTWAAPSATGPGSQLDYAQITSSQTAVTATTEGTSVAQITGNSITYDGTQVKVTVYIPQVTNSGAATGIFVLYRDSTVLGQHKIVSNGSSGVSPPYIEMLDTPAAGAHTYKVALFISGGTNLQVNAGAGGSGNLLPAFIRVTKA